jgi:SAM-dependent methyltransferase
MSINQINPELNDAFETYYPNLGLWNKLVYWVLTKSIETGLQLRKRTLPGKLLVNERIVEYPLILRWIKPQNRILDLGCCSSRLPIQLASLGYEVYGLDVREYPYQHPNFHFIQQDLFNWQPQQKFDSIIAVSVIEHIGIGEYGDTMLENGDYKAVAKLASVLNEQGQFLVSVPFGKSGITAQYRVYDAGRLNLLFRDFDWISAAYFKRHESYWTPTSAEDLRDTSSLELPINGVAILNLQLK